MCDARAARVPDVYFQVRGQAGCVIFRPWSGQMCIVFSEDVDFESPLTPQRTCHLLFSSFYNAATQMTAKLALENFFAAPLAGRAVHTETARCGFSDLSGARCVFSGAQTAGFVGAIWVCGPNLGCASISR